MKHKNKQNHKSFLYYARTRAGIFFCLNGSTGLMAFIFAVSLFSLFLIGSTSVCEARSKKKFDVNKGFKSRKTSDRLHALQKIRRKEGNVSVEKLKQAKTSEKNPLVRHRLNQALVATQKPFDTSILIHSLKTDSHSVVRQGAAQELGNFAGSRVVRQALIESLKKDKSSEVRYACAMSLALSDTPESVNALEKAAKDSDPRLRQQVAFSLKRHTSKKAKAVVKRLKNDSDENVRKIARQKK